MVSWFGCRKPLPRRVRYRRSGLHRSAACLVSLRICHVPRSCPFGSLPFWLAESAPRGLRGRALLGNKPRGNKPRGNKPRGNKPRGFLEIVVSDLGLACLWPRRGGRLGAGGSSRGTARTAGTV